MEKVVFISILVTFIFSVFKFLEARYLEEDNEDSKPLKFYVRDALIVFVSSMIASYITMYMGNSVSELIDIVTETKTVNNAATQIFTGNPEF